MTPCPTGLAGRIRKMRVQELLEMTEAAAKGGSDGGFWKVLGALWEETTDAGPYPFVEPGPNRVDFRRALLGDAMHALIQARIVTVGPEHEIPYTCFGCGEPGRADVNLEQDLVVRPLPAASAKTIREGRDFTATVAGQTVRFRLATPAHTESVEALRKVLQRDLKNGRRTSLPPRDKYDLFAAQTTFIEALGEERSRDQRARLEWFWDLTLDDAAEFEAQVDEHDCGFDDLLEHRCLACGAKNRLALPLDRSFFRPPTKKRATAARQAMATTPITAISEANLRTPRAEPDTTAS